MKAPVHWLPPTLKCNGLKKIFDEAIGGGTFEKVPNKIDQAVIYVLRERERKILHYVEINYGNESCFLLVTVPGRRTACRHCNQSDHWTNRCPNDRKAPEKQESYAQKASKPTPTPTKTTGPNRESEVDADVETDGEEATWTTD